MVVQVKSERKPAMPGEIEIRPTRTDIEKSGQQFYRWLEMIREMTGLNAETIARVIDYETENTDSNISKKIKKQSFDEDEKRKLIEYVFVEQSLLSGRTRKQLAGIDDALYFAFLNYFDAKETSQDSARARVVGTYKLWRCSVGHQNEYVLGRLDFTEDPKTRAVTVSMVQVRRATAQEREMTEHFSGYLFRVSHMYVMMLRDEITNDFRLTLFPRSKLDVVGTDVNPRSVIAGSRVHIVQMDGFGLGIDGSSAFFSPVHLSLVDDVDDLNRLDDELDVIAEDDPRMPRRVINKLTLSGPMRRL